MDSKILYEKDGMKFTKLENKKYCLEFSMENKNINMVNIVDFSLIKLIYDLNCDIYESVDLQKLNENQATVTLLMKHLFEDLGLVQKFSYLYIKREVTENKITFLSKTIKSERPPDMPPDSELMPIENMIIDFHIITPHKIKLSCNILFQDKTVLLPIIEKIFSIALFKIFTRVKQFIENVTV